jgi:hypothetical protein
MPERRVAGNVVLTIAMLLSSACGSSSKQSAPPAAKSDSAGPGVAQAAPPGAPTCPATGLWAQCSVLYRLDRAGIAPHLDTTATAEEKALTGNSFVVKFGMNSRLEVFLYADSAARIADGKKLDRTKLVDGTATQTIRRERTLIENANLLGLLTSLNGRLRERVSDALTAGAPQPPTPVVVK